MSDLTPLEIAENLEFIDKAILIKGIGPRYDTLRKSIVLAASYLRAFATGEYKQVVHGRWIKERSQFYCSCCNEIALDDLQKYCPSCGALMDESRDGNSHNGKEKTHE